MNISYMNADNFGVLQGPRRLQQSPPFDSYTVIPPHVAHAVNPNGYGNCQRYGRFCSQTVPSVGQGIYLHAAQTNPVEAPACRNKNFHSSIQCGAKAIGGYTAQHHNPINGTTSTNSIPSVFRNSRNGHQRYQGLYSVPTFQRQVPSNQFAAMDGTGTRYWNIPHRNRIVGTNVRSVSSVADTHCGCNANISAVSNSSLIRQMDRVMQPIANANSSTSTHAAVQRTHEQMRSVPPTTYNTQAITTRITANTSSSPVVTLRYYPVCQPSGTGRAVEYAKDSRFRVPACTLNCSTATPRRQLQPQPLERSRKKTGNSDITPDFLEFINSPRVPHRFSDNDDNGFWLCDPVVWRKYQESKKRSFSLGTGDNVSPATHTSNVCSSASQTLPLNQTTYSISRATPAHVLAYSSDQSACMGQTLPADLSCGTRGSLPHDSRNLNCQSSNALTEPITSLNAASTISYFAEKISSMPAKNLLPSQENLASLAGAPKQHFVDDSSLKTAVTSRYLENKQSNGSVSRMPSSNNQVMSITTESRAAENGVLCNISSAPDMDLTGAKTLGPTELDISKKLDRTEKEEMSDEESIPTIVNVYSLRETKQEGTEHETCDVVTSENAKCAVNESAKYDFDVGRENSLVAKDVAKEKSAPVKSGVNFNGLEENSKADQEAAELKLRDADHSLTSHGIDMLGGVQNAKAYVGQEVIKSSEAGIPASAHSKMWHGVVSVLTSRSFGDGYTPVTDITQKYLHKQKTPQTLSNSAVPDPGDQPRLEKYNAAAGASKQLTGAKKKMRRTRRHRSTLVRSSSTTPRGSSPAVSMLKRSRHCSLETTRSLHRRITPDSGLTQNNSTDFLSTCEMQNLSGVEHAMKIQIESRASSSPLSLTSNLLTGNNPTYSCFQPKAKEAPEILNDELLCMEQSISTGSQTVKIDCEMPARTNQSCSKIPLEMSFRSEHDESDGECNKDKSTVVRPSSVTPRGFSPVVNVTKRSRCYSLGTSQSSHHDSSLVQKKATDFSSVCDKALLSANLLTSNNPKYGCFQPKAKAAPEILKDKRLCRENSVFTGSHTVQIDCQVLARSKSPLESNLHLDHDETDTKNHAGDPSRTVVDEQPFYYSSLNWTYQGKLESENAATIDRGNSAQNNANDKRTPLRLSLEDKSLLAKGPVNCLEPPVQNASERKGNLSLFSLCNAQQVQFGSAQTTRTQSDVETSGEANVCRKNVPTLQTMRRTINMSPSAFHPKGKASNPKSGSRNCYQRKKHLRKILPSVAKTGTTCNLNAETNWETVGESPGSAQCMYFDISDDEGVESLPDPPIEDSELCLSGNASETCSGGSTSMISILSFRQNVADRSRKSNLELPSLPKPLKENFGKIGSRDIAQNLPIVETDDKRATEMLDNTLRIDCDGTNKGSGGARCINPDETDCNNKDVDAPKSTDGDETKGGYFYLSAAMKSCIEQKNEEPSPEETQSQSPQKNSDVPFQQADSEELERMWPFRLPEQDLAEATEEENECDVGFLRLRRRTASLMIKNQTSKTNANIADNRNHSRRDSEGVFRGEASLDSLEGRNIFDDICQHIYPNPKITSKFTNKDIEWQNNERQFSPSLSRERGSGKCRRKSLGEGLPRKRNFDLSSENAKPLEAELNRRRVINEAEEYNLVTKMKTFSKKKHRRLLQHSSFDEQCSIRAERVAISCKNSGARDKIQSKRLRKSSSEDFAFNSLNTNYSSNRTSCDGSMFEHCQNDFTLSEKISSQKLASGNPTFVGSQGDSRSQISESTSPANTDLQPELGILGSRQSMTRNIFDQVCPHSRRNTKTKVRLGNWKSKELNVLNTLKIQPLPVTEKVAVPRDDDSLLQKLISIGAVTDEISSEKVKMPCQTAALQNPTLPGVKPKEDLSPEQIESSTGSLKDEIATEREKPCQFTSEMSQLRPCIVKLRKISITRKTVKYHRNR